MPTKEKNKTNVKKLKLPKVEILDTTEDISIPAQPVTESVKKAVKEEAEIEKISKMTKKEQEVDLANKLEKILKVTDQPKSVVKSAVQIKAEKEAAEYISPRPVNEVAEAIDISVILVPLGTNHRQIRLAFDVRTNQIRPSDIADIVQVVLKKAAPMIGTKLVEAINVEKVLLDATRQK